MDIDENKAQKTIRIMIADDHAMVRAGLKQILSGENDLEIVAEANDGMEAIDKAMKLQPDVILMDIFMPRCSGLDAIAILKEKNPSIKMLVVTVSDHEEDLFKAIRFGAEGYILKNAPIKEVVEAVRRTVSGEAWLSPVLATKLFAEFRQKSENGINLSKREKEILLLVGQGLTNSNIAEKLFIAESTVRTHLQRLLEKLHLNNRAEAIAYANRNLIQSRPN